MNWLEQCESEAKALTAEQRQAVLDTIWHGKTIGEAREMHGLSLAAVCGVVNINIADAKFLNRKSV